LGIIWDKKRKKKLVRGTTAAEQVAGTSKFPHLPSKTDIERKNRNSTLVTIQTRKLKLREL
jgi:hypothetical protein